MIEIQLPMTMDVRRSLRAGEEVRLNGVIYTARDAAHRRFHELIEKNLPLPVEINDAVIYYAGPTPARPGHVIGSAGPTTSSRMDPYVGELAERGLAAMIGKGRRSEEVHRLIQKYQMIYFAAPGGAGALLSHCIVSSQVIAFDDLLAEAVRRLEVKDFPCFVGIDTRGNDIYDLNEGEEE